MFMFLQVKSDVQNHVNFGSEIAVQSVSFQLFLLNFQYSMFVGVSKFSSLHLRD